MKKDYAPELNEGSFGVSRESHDYYAARTRQWRNRVGLGVLGVVLLFWAYTLFYTPFFAVQSVQIEGIIGAQKNEFLQRLALFLTTRRWGIFPQKNIFLLHLKDFTDVFQNDARVERVMVEKNYFARSLAVTITERTAVAILALPDRAFAIDKEGIALVPLSVPLPPQTMLPVIFDRRQRDASLGLPVIENGAMQFLHTIITVLVRIAPFTSITIGEPSPDAATITTQEGWTIYINFTVTPNEQLERLKVLLATKIKSEKRKKLQYIDLRFGERVYYK